MSKSKNTIKNDYRDNIVGLPAATLEGVLLRHDWRRGVPEDPKDEHGTITATARDGSQLWDHAINVIGQDDPGPCLAFCCLFQPDTALLLWHVSVHADVRGLEFHQPVDDDPQRIAAVMRTLMDEAGMDPRLKINARGNTLLDAAMAAYAKALLAWARTTELAGGTDAKHDA